MLYLRPFKLTVGVLVALNVSNLWSGLMAEPLPVQVLLSRAPGNGTTGNPSNQTSGGGGLDGGRACPSAPIDLRILVPEQNPVLTASDQPTLWVYVPYEAAKIRNLELALNIYNADGEEDYLDPPVRQSVTLPATPGIFGIRLPAGLVQPGQGYRWYLGLYCQGNGGPEPDQAVNAGLQRVMLDSSDVVQANPPSYWYDRVTTLARQRLAEPNNPQLQRQWQALLTEIGQSDIADQPLLGEVELLAP